MPAVLVLAAHRGMLMEKELAAVRVTPHNGRVIQRCESIAVLVVWGGAELQEGLGKELKVITGLMHGTNRRHPWITFPWTKLTYSAWIPDVPPDTHRTGES